jgi:tRNA(Ile)-lysidine synthase
LRDESLIKKLEQHALSVLEEEGFRGKKLIVGVSGGQDSLALLQVLFNLSDYLGLKLWVAHLSHGIRASGRADSSFVEKEARRLGLAFVTKKVNTPAYKLLKKLSLEEAARELRYEFLGSVCETEGANAILLGHTSDDQAETVLMNLARGSGIRGASGMSVVSDMPVKGFGSARIVRPFLGITRGETLAYCKAMGLSPRLDPSNLSLKFSRNRIRLQALPVLEKLNPMAKANIGRFSKILEQVNDYLDLEVARVWPSAVTTHGKSLHIKREPLGLLHPALRQHLLKTALIMVRRGSQDLSKLQLGRMESATSSKPGKTIELGAGIVLVTGYGEIYLGHKEDIKGTQTLLKDTMVDIPGTSKLNEWLVRADIVDFGSEYEESKLVECLDLEAIGSPLWVRHRVPGDKFLPLGLSGEKKLQDFMVDSKIPRYTRNRVPLLVSPKGIAWVVGWRLSHWAKVTKQTQRVVRVEFEKMKA